MEKVGVYFGGLCPFHRGHLDVIIRAKRECSRVCVIVCGYDGESRALDINLTLPERFSRVKKFFKDDSLVSVYKINDTELGLDESMSDNNWKIWTKEMLRQTGLTQEQVVIYVSEPFYKEALGRLGFEVVLCEKRVPVSGTLIRSNPAKYWEYIIPTFRDTFTKGILITGTASEGKTTLCKDISKYWGIPWIPEFGRLYMEERCLKDTDLGVKEFSEFMIHQRDLAEQARESGESQYYISDTSNLVTLMYAKAYTEDPDVPITKEDYETILKPLAKSLWIPWKKVFLIKPENEFHDDGVRYMKQSSMDGRMKNYRTLVELLKEFGQEYEEIEGGNFKKIFDTVSTFIDGDRHRAFSI